MLTASRRPPSSLRVPWRTCQRSGGKSRFLPVNRFPSACISPRPFVVVLLHDVRRADYWLLLRPQLHTSLVWIVVKYRIDGRSRITAAHTIARNTSTHCVKILSPVQNLWCLLLTNRLPGLLEPRDRRRRKPLDRLAKQRFKRLVEVVRRHPLQIQPRNHCLQTPGLLQIRPRTYRKRISN